MKITDLAAYNRLREWFEKQGYTEGVKDDMPIYCWDNVSYTPSGITPGHYVYAIEYSKLKLCDVPYNFRTREFFLHTLSGAYEELVDYVKAHIEDFDKQFFKDHMATDYYSLEFELNDFEYMPLEYIDEEMVACAMFRAINMRYAERRGDCDDWFYSVYRRKPEVLTQDLYILGARCFAEKRGGVNKFLEITPKEYRTPEYYFALCLRNSTRVMEDIPDEILTTNFLITLINESVENIRSFSEKALEMEAEMQGRGKVKFWQAAIINDGYSIRDIPLNEERINFFLSLYAKDTPQYEYGFKSHYKAYLREKNGDEKPRNTTNELAGMMALMGAMSGMSNDEAIDQSTEFLKGSTNRKTHLPIYYANAVPEKYSKVYDKEEYLLEIYNKLGIQVEGESDYFYYDVVIPNNLSVSMFEGDYVLKDETGNILIRYYDRGPFYDRAVNVTEINVTL
ncbi:MAG: hypothetical protein IKK84_02900 [Clostridia bacterium]|nr:hypothetical protein [Clostridia bacterium]